MLRMAGENRFDCSMVKLSCIDLLLVQLLLEIKSFLYPLDNDLIRFPMTGHYASIDYIFKSKLVPSPRPTIYKKSQGVGK